MVGYSARDGVGERAGEAFFARIGKSSAQDGAEPSSQIERLVVAKSGRTRRLGENVVQERRAQPQQRSPAEFTGQRVGDHDGDPVAIERVKSTSTCDSIGGDLESQPMAEIR